MDLTCSRVGQDDPGPHFSEAHVEKDDVMNAVSSNLAELMAKLPKHEPQLQRAA